MAPPHLLPATNTHGQQVFIPIVPSEKISSFTLRRGTVIWHIWPSVLIYTIFSAVVVAISHYTDVNLGVPNVLLTVCGVVIGFVLSYRASSGYDRYWMGRSSWADIIRNCRTLGRLVWFHVPCRISGNSGDAISEDDFNQAIREKRMALKLIEAFAVATKHHLRGEMGILYEDLYHLIPTLHSHSHNAPPADIVHPPPLTHGPLDHPHLAINVTVEAPPQNGYGTEPGLRHRQSTSSVSSEHSEHEALLPSDQPTSPKSVAGDLAPFSSIGNLFSPSAGDDVQTAPARSGKHRPKVAGGGEIVPLLILWTISDWLAVCERRGVVPGTSLGTMIAVLASFEDSLTQLEKVLTTPLPFVYAVHIRHTVWLYILCLPFQLVDMFGIWTIPGVAIATFFFIGLLAAGEEIEQPFGYDENDLDLDVFTRDIINNELNMLARTPGLYNPPKEVREAALKGNARAEERMHAGSIVEACLPKGHHGVAQRAEAERKKIGPGPKKKNQDGILVDLHVPPATAPGVTPGAGELHPVDRITATATTN